MLGLAALLTGEELFADILKLEYEPEAEAHLVQRRGLRCVSFRRNGRLIRRVLREDVLDWLAAESGKRGSRDDTTDGGER